MTVIELQAMVEEEIASCLYRIQRNDQATFYEGKLAGLTLIREKLPALTNTTPLLSGNKIEWHFKEGASCYTDDFWYDLTDGGYIEPEKILVNQEQITQLRAAIDLVRSLQRTVEARDENGW